MMRTRFAIDPHVRERARALSSVVGSDARSLEEEEIVLAARLSLPLLRAQSCSLDPVHVGGYHQF